MHILSLEFSKTKDWLLNSGLFLKDETISNSGGVYSYYDEKEKKFNFIYPEITGYYISTMRFLNHVEKNAIYIKYAKLASDWIIKIWEKYGNIIQRINENNNKQNYAYSFDVGICAKGLIDCYLISNEEKYLNYSKKLVNYLITSALDDDGTFKPYKNLSSNSFEESDEVWYKKKGCLHIKTAIPIFQLFQITNDSSLLDSAGLICNSIKKFQKDTGEIHMHLDDNIINLHSFSYSLEGLIFGYYYTKNAKYLQAIKNGIDWCLSKIEDDGSLPLWFNSKHKSKATYPIAQLIRILILVDKIIDGTNYYHSAKKLSDYLLTMQASNPDPNIDGGFYEEFYKSNFQWKKRLRINSWTSMFALQAIYWLENYDKIKLDEEIKLIF